MSNDFKAGDVVEVKSGGPPMTVVKVKTDLVGYTEITCRWFFMTMETGTFTPDVLVPSKPRKFEELKSGFAAMKPTTDGA